MSDESNQKQGWVDLTPEDAYKMIEEKKEKPNFQILDIRTKLERMKKRLHSTTHYDFYKSDFRDHLDKLDRNKTYLVHCAVGGRSAKAAQMMTEEMGFKHVYNLAGSLEEMQALGAETTWGWGA